VHAIFPMLCGAAAIALAAGGVLARLRRRYSVVVVRGLSMAPTLRGGDQVLARRVHGTQVRAGDVVILLVPDGEDDEPGLPAVSAIKRVAAAAGDPLPPEARSGALAAGGVVPPGRLAVLGDNRRASVDSRAWGLVSVESVLAKVVRTL